MNHQPSTNPSTYLDIPFMDAFFRFDIITNKESTFFPPLKNAYSSFSFILSVQKEGKSYRSILSSKLINTEIWKYYRSLAELPNGTSFIGLSAGFRNGVFSTLLVLYNVILNNKKFLKKYRGRIFAFQANGPGSIPDTVVVLTINYAD
ncbi:hypothetical protein H8356DRAFT_1332809 [Neocallimastix lanati (nom. inval.)]|nr:hypothetical protein H8356DRAFT_1332809 [Neocallimastix sp. JGI-2020a]